MSGVGMSRFPIASKQLIIAHLSELMVKIWPEIAAVSGEDLVWRQLAVGHVPSSRACRGATHSQTLDNGPHRRLALWGIDNQRTLRIGTPGGPSRE